MIMRFICLMNWRVVSRPTMTAMLLVAAIGVGLLNMPTIAQQTVTDSRIQGRQISLRDQLVKGLRATTEGDFAFIDKVIILVEQGKLPRRVVDGTFLWARQRAERHSWARSLRPMVYFQPALTLRAKRIGAQL